MLQRQHVLVPGWIEIYKTTREGLPPITLTVWTVNQRIFVSAHGDGWQANFSTDGAEFDVTRLDGQAAMMRDLIHLQLVKS